LRRRAARILLRQRAIASRRRRRATQAANAEVPVRLAEAAVGAALPLQAQAARDDPRLPLLLHRLRTRPPAGRTNRIARDLFARQQIAIRARSCPRSPRPRRDRRKPPRTSHISPIPAFSHPERLGP